MQRNLAPLAEAIMEERGLRCRTLTHTYKTKKHDFSHTAYFILQKGIYLHLGSKVSCEKFLYGIHNAN